MGRPTEAKSVRQLASQTSGLHSGGRRQGNGQASKSILINLKIVLIQKPKYQKLLINFQVSPVTGAVIRLQRREEGLQNIPVT